MLILSDKLQYNNSRLKGHIDVSYVHKKKGFWAVLISSEKEVRMRSSKLP